MFEIHCRQSVLIFLLFLPLHKGLLWAAPEILRAQGSCKTGTQKGDVYSFAIILYEIHGRNGPYGDIALGPKGE